MPALPILIMFRTKSKPLISLGTTHARSRVLGSREGFALGADRGADAWCFGGVA